MSDFKFSIIQEYAPFFLSGTWLTIKLSLIAILCGFLLGLVLALSRISKRNGCPFHHCSLSKAYAGRRSSCSC